MIHPAKIQVTKGTTHIERARKIAATLGPYTAARYLEKRNWSIEAALYILLGK